MNTSADAGGWRAFLRLATIVAVLAPGAALADFGARILLSPAGQHADDAQVAMDPQGDALIVWLNTSNGRIQARLRRANGTLGAVANISDPGEFASDPQVGMAANGDALIAWLRSDGTNSRVQARSRLVTGALGAIDTLSPAGDDAFDARVAVASTGRAVVIWRLADRVQLRIRSVAGSFGPVRTASATGAPVAFPIVGIANSGAAFIAWVRNDGTGPDLLQSRICSASGAFGLIRDVSLTTSQAANPDLAIDADGDGLVIWDNLPQSGQRRIQSRAQPREGGALSPVQDVSAIVGFLPQLSMQNDGDAIAVWYNMGRILSRRIFAGGQLGGIQNVTTSGTDDRPQVAYDENGIAAIVWEHDQGSTTRIQARARSTSGAYGPIQTLSVGSFDAEEPQIAMEGGVALAVWAQPDANGVTRIQAAAGP